MKFVDDKGRLFGKVNIIDFLVIVFLLSLSPMVYFGYKISNYQQAKSGKDYIPIMIRCKFVKLKPEVSQMISIGDKEFDSNGNIIAEIVSLSKFTPYVRKFEIGSNRELFQGNPGLQQAIATLRIKAEVRGKGLYYNNDQIVEGASFEFSPSKYSVEIEDLAIIQDNRNIIIDGSR